MVGHEATRENRRGSENRCVNQTKVNVLSAAIVRSTIDLRTDDCGAIVTWRFESEC